jgi:hypothetical protein
LFSLRKGFCLQVQVHSVWHLQLPIDQLPVAVWTAAVAEEVLAQELAVAEEVLAQELAVAEEVLAQELALALA